MPGVRELSGERGEKGRYERSARDVAEVLGITEVTVKRDREVWEALGIPSTQDRPQGLVESLSRSRAALRRKRPVLTLTKAQHARALDRATEIVSRLNGWKV